MATDKLTKFLVTLASDPETLAAYFDDPRAALRRAEIEPQDADLLLSGDQMAIYSRLNPPQPHDELREDHAAASPAAPHAQTAAAHGNAAAVPQYGYGRPAEAQPWWGSGPAYGQPPGAYPWWSWPQAGP